MKNTVKILALAAAAVFAFASCETYKVAEPDMTAISNVDGKYVAFAYENGASDPSTLFGIVITNNTNNDADKGWMTITDMSPYIYGSYYYLDAVRFEISIDTKAQTFSANAVSATEPRTAWNPYLEGWYGSYGGYYTGGYIYGYSNYTITLSGKVTSNGVKTANGTADAIEFTYSRTYPDGQTKNYTVSGMVKTGWLEDVQEYEDFINENWM